MLWQSYDSVLNIIGKYNGMQQSFLKNAGLGLSTIVLSTSVLKYNCT